MTTFQTPFAMMFLQGSEAHAAPAAALADAFARTVASHRVHGPALFADLFFRTEAATPAEVSAAFARTAALPAPRRAMRSPVRPAARRGAARPATRRAA